MLSRLRRAARDADPDLLEAGVEDVRPVAGLCIHMFTIDLGVEYGPLPQAMFSPSP